MATEATYPPPSLKVEVIGPTVRTPFELQIKTWGVDKDDHGTADTYPLQVNFNCPQSGLGVLEVSNWRHGAIRCKIDDKYEIIGGSAFFNTTDKCYTDTIPTMTGGKPPPAAVIQYVKCAFFKTDRTSGDFRIAANSDESGKWMGTFDISFILHFKPVTN